MIKVVLAEDQGMLRGALTALLNLEEDIEVLAEAADGETALETIRRLQPDICILDIEMPGKSGLGVAEEIKRAGLPCKVVILTTFAQPGYLQRALQAGVQGYMLKDAPVEQLAKALRQVQSGGRVIAPELALAVWEESNPLSERDRKILQLIAEGLKNAEIAQRLFLSDGTMRNYVSEILQKLNAKSRIEALNIAKGKGLVGMRKRHGERSPCLLVLQRQNHGDEGEGEAGFGQPFDLPMSCILLAAPDHSRIPHCNRLVNSPSTASFRTSASRTTRSKPACH